MPRNFETETDDLVDGQSIFDEAMAGISVPDAEGDAECGAVATTSHLRE